MSISRKHLEIYYNFEAKRWEFKVLGKNGCFVNRVVHNPESEPGTLESGSLLQFGGGGEAGAADYSQGVSVCFLLPGNGEAPAGKRKIVHSARPRKRPKPAGVANGVQPPAGAGAEAGAVPRGGGGAPQASTRTASQMPRPDRRRTGTSWGRRTPWPNSSRGLGDGAPH